MGKDQLLVKDGILFSYLIKILLLANVKDKNEITTLDIKHIDEITFSNFSTDLEYEDRENINDLIFDIFLIFTNFDEGIKMMKAKDLYKVLNLVKTKMAYNKHLGD